MTTQEPEIKLKNMLDYTDEELAQFVKVRNAMKGRSPIDKPDLMQFNVNLKNINERTRFLTFPLLKEAVYFQLLAKMHPIIAIKAQKYADLMEECLISYKGLSREEFKEITKHAVNQPESTFIGTYSGSPPMQQKKGFLSRFRRGRTSEESEFKQE